MQGSLLAGKKGLVLGVANERSIAWACAQQCAEQGAELAFSYLGEAQEKRVRKLLEENGLAQSVLMPLDVGSDDSLQSFFDGIRKEWDTIDFVIHSIAFADRDTLRAPFSETTRQQFTQALDISAYSYVAVARHAAPLMSHGGSMVAMSYLGADRVVPHYNVMGVAKAALEASTRYLASDLGERGIRVNAISAGPIRTLSSSAIPGIRDMLDVAKGSAPLRRNTEQADVGKAAVYLLSDLASGVTGEIHYVDCGYNTLGMAQPNPK